MYTTACGMLCPIRWATYWVQHTTNCSVQSNAPKDGQNCGTKHVELILIHQ